MIDSVSIRFGIRKLEIIGTKNVYYKRYDKTERRIDLSIIQIEVASIGGLNDTSLSFRLPLEIEWQVAVPTWLRRRLYLPNVYFTAAKSFLLQRTFGVLSWCDAASMLHC